RTSASDFDPRFNELAAHVNRGMPHHVADLVGEALNAHGKSIGGARVLVAGVTCRKDVDDIRQSAALDVMTLLDVRGAILTFTDPYIATLPADDWGGERALTASELTPATVRAADCVVVLTDHSAFDYAMLCAEADIVVDTRNATAGCAGSGGVF